MRKIAAFLYRHRRDKPIWIAALLAHLIYILVWRLTDGTQRDLIEDKSVTVAMVSASIFYTIIIIAYGGAQRTRLNKALALNKLFWDFVIIFLALPRQTGWWGYAPQWWRTYIWWGVALTIGWVLYEFVAINWKRRRGFPYVERRQFTRRASDRAAMEELAWYRAKYGLRPMHDGGT